MDLLLDIGNTRCKYCLSNASVFGEVFNCTCAELEDVIQDIIKTYNINNVAISNVSNLHKELINFLRDRVDKVLVVSGDMNLPFKNFYATPKTLGADRVCAVLGALSLFPNQNCIIFDFGTAITIDFLNNNAEYLGGNISLGLSTRLKALNNYTKRLPLVEICDDIPDIGTSTEEAIRAGIILGTIFEVESYFAKYPDYKIIFTGGDAFYFEKKIKNPTFVVSNLIFYGLARLLEYYADK